MSARCALTLPALLLGGPALACEGPVTLDGVQRFDSVQAAIDAAEPGAVVELCPGIYREALVVEQDLVLVGLEGSEATVIDAGGAGSAIAAFGGELHLEGLTLTGGTGTMSKGHRVGGGVFAWRAEGLSAVDLVLEGNRADYGGGLAGTSAGLSDLLVDVVARDNRAAEMGGGLYLRQAQLENVDVVGNRAWHGAGVTVVSGWVEADSATTVRANRAAGDGGGVALWMKASWSGGGISDNGAGRYGGGVYGFNGAVLRDAQVVGNHADVAGGGVIVTSGTLDVESSDLIGNTSGDAGGLMASMSSVSVRDSILEGNAVARSGGGLFAANASDVTVRRSQVVGNRAARGEAAYVTGSLLASQQSDWGSDRVLVRFRGQERSYEGLGAPEELLCSGECR